MKFAVPLRIVLFDPPSGVTYAVQRGKGSKYTVDFAQTPKRGDVTFDFTIDVTDKAGSPHFSGEYVQGTPARRFIYIDVGTYAGQNNTPWSRRMIVLLNGITQDQINKALEAGHRLCARVPGTGKDGGPNCATVPLINGWQVIEDT
jgi:hypothetical protein